MDTANLPDAPFQTFADIFLRQAEYTDVMWMSTGSCRKEDTSC